MNLRNIKRYRIGFNSFKYIFEYGFRYIYDLDFRKVAQKRNRDRLVRKKRGSGFLGNRKSIKNRLAKRDGCKCQWCNKKFKKELLTIDHIKQVAIGGSNNMDNLRLLCIDCHRIKDSNFNGIYSI